MNPKAVAKVAGKLRMIDALYDMLNIRMKPLFNGAICRAVVIIKLSSASGNGGRDETTKIVKMLVISRVTAQSTEARPTVTLGCRTEAEVCV